MSCCVLLWHHSFETRICSGRASSRAAGKPSSFNLASVLAAARGKSVKKPQSQTPQDAGPSTASFLVDLDFYPSSSITSESVKAPPPLPPTLQSINIDSLRTSIDVDEVQAEANQRSAPQALQPPLPPTLLKPPAPPTLSESSLTLLNESLQFDGVSATIPEEAPPSRPPLPPSLRASTRQSTMPTDISTSSFQSDTPLPDGDASFDLRPPSEVGPAEQAGVPPSPQDPFHGTPSGRQPPEGQPPADEDVAYPPLPPGPPPSQIPPPLPRGPPPSTASTMSSLQSHALPAPHAAVPGRLPHGAMFPPGRGPFMNVPPRGHVPGLMPGHPPGPQQYMGRGGSMGMVHRPLARGPHHLPGKGKGGFPGAAAAGVPLLQSSARSGRLPLQNWAPANIFLRRVWCICAPSGLSKFRWIFWSLIWVTFVPT